MSDHTEPFTFYFKTKPKRQKNRNKLIFTLQPGYEPTWPLTKLTQAILQGKPSALVGQTMMSTAEGIVGITCVDECEKMCINNENRRII